MKQQKQMCVTFRCHGYDVRMAFVLLFTDDNGMTARKE